MAAGLPPPKDEYRSMHILPVSVGKYETLCGRGQEEVGSGVEV